MGIVFEVRKDPAGILGAMKVLRGAFAEKRTWVNRFLAEAQLLATVRHPNIVEVIDYDTFGDGTPFMVMTLLQGQTLRRCLRRAREEGARVTARNIWAIVSELCEGLHVLHSQPVPVVHGDVKPDNIFLQEVENVAGTATVKLLDFGLARASGPGAAYVLGTPRYMAPEQLRGEAVSGRANQYSAALVTYEMLTGRSPWDVPVRDVEAVVEAHLRRKPSPPSLYCPWIPARIDEAILRALAKDPAERWASVAEFADRLRVLDSVNDGSAYADPDVNTTAPTMGTLAAGLAGNPGAHDTEQLLDMPPVDGPPPELAELVGDPCGPSGSTEVEGLLAGLRSTAVTVPGTAPPEVMRLARGPVETGRSDSIEDAPTVDLGRGKGHRRRRDEGTARATATAIQLANGRPGAAAWDLRRGRFGFKRPRSSRRPCECAKRTQRDHSHDVANHDVPACRATPKR